MRSAYKGCFGNRKQWSVSDSPAVFHWSRRLRACSSCASTLLAGLLLICDERNQLFARGVGQSASALTFKGDRERV